MKTRYGFVSNSSSSSFIVIGGHDLVIPKYEDTVLHVPEDFRGETEFGWQEEEYHDFGSRLNFAYLQVLETEDEYLQSMWLMMLENVLKLSLRVEEIEWNITTSYSDSDGGVYGYIDHQSSAMEGRNTEMFETEGILQRFLFAPESSITTDNDNH